MLALLDADVIIYEGGFGSDAQAKKPILESMDNDKEKYKEWLKHNEKPHESLDYCLHSVKKTIEGKVQAAGASRVIPFLSHPVNYREQMYPPYKMNRDVTHKPYWAEEIKDYLLEEWGAVFSKQGDEADDALGIAQTEARAAREETIIVTIDKDLDMIPGWHYNWSKTNKEKGNYFVKDPQGLQQFYTQILTGDTADNIPGMFKHMGIKAKADYLYPLERMRTEKEMYEYVLKVYKGDTEFVHLVAKLLWIKRDNNFWEPPK